MTTKIKAAGLCGTPAASNSELNVYLTLRLAPVKAALVRGYHHRRLSYHEAETIAVRMRARYREAWGAS